MTETVTELLGAWARKGFESALGGDLEADAVIQVVETGNPEFGDYQCNAAMPLAKSLRRNPREIGQSVLEALPGHEAVERLELAGPGFINIFLKSDWLADRVMTMTADSGLLIPAVGEGRTVVLDYSSPNVAKPMHIGHIRSTVIGNALDRMHRALGYRVVADNHLGDWGTQFGILIMGYRHFLDAGALEASPVEELERLYVKSYERAKEDEAWMDSARAELVKLQSGDAENRALWTTFVELSLKEFGGIYERIDVSFDLMRGESYYHERLAGVVDRLVEAGIAEESEGAKVVFLEDEGLGVCIVQKRDGGFNYATTDLATVESRIEEFQPERIVYVTDERQQQHFRQFFTIASKLGHDCQLDHVWFGLMRLPEATFSTREGNVIKLEHLLDEAETRALDLVKEYSPQMPEETQKEVARAVGIGAVKYADLSQNPQSLVTFTWEKALAMNGNSAPYLQYAYARIQSVRDKYSSAYPDSDPAQYPVLLGEPAERALALTLIRFPEVVVQATHAYKPSTLADFLYELAGQYSSFYKIYPF